ATVRGDIAVDLLVIQRADKVPKLMGEDAQVRSRADRMPGQRLAVEHDGCLLQRTRILVKPEKSEEAKDGRIIGYIAIAVENDRVLKWGIAANELAYIRPGDIDRRTGRRVQDRAGVMEPYG